MKNDHEAKSTTEADQQLMAELKELRRELAEALEKVTSAVAETARTPTVLGRAISLMTQYQDSLIRPRWSTSSTFTWIS